MTSCHKRRKVRELREQTRGQGRLHEASLALRLGPVGFVGRRLAYTVKTKWAGVTKATRVRISINQNGKLRVR